MWLLVLRDIVVDDAILMKVIRVGTIVIALSAADHMTDSLLHPILIVAVAASFGACFGSGRLRGVFGS
jgi:hypothetical protein